MTNKIKKFSRADRNRERHHQRLYAPKLKNKKRAGKRKYPGINRKRWISNNERWLIVEMMGLQARYSRLDHLNGELNKLGAFKARSTWGNNKEIILKLYQIRRKVQEELKEIKPYAQLKNAYNCGPYYVAKHLKIDVVIIYSILRLYARTGDVVFNRDRRTHISLSETVENSIPLHLPQPKQDFISQAHPAVQELLRARIAPNPCAARPNAEVRTIDSNPPLPKDKRVCNNVVSKQRFSQLQLGRHYSHLLFDEIVSDEDWEARDIRQNPEDYHRDTINLYSRVTYGFKSNQTTELIEEQDMPPLTYPIYQFRIDLGLATDKYDYTDLGCEVYNIPVVKFQPTWCPAALL